MSVESYRGLERLGRHQGLFDEIFAQCNAGTNPLCCITPIVDGKPKIERITDHFPMTLSKFREHPRKAHLPYPMPLPPDSSDEAIADPTSVDYMPKYLTDDGFDFPRLLDDDFFQAIRLLFNHRYFVSATKLLMTFIDTAGFVEFGDTGENTFVKWLDVYATTT